MKFKFDFVTNSSSVCYIVFIPSSFIVTDEMIQDGLDTEMTWWESVDEEEEFPTVKDIRKEIDECIESLKEGNSIYTNPYGDGVDIKVWTVIKTTLGGAGLFLNSVDMSSDEGDSILGIKEDVINKILINNIDLTNFIKVIQ
jgi:hypothetical protein